MFDGSSCNVCENVVASKDCSKLGDSTNTTHVTNKKSLAEYISYDAFGVSVCKYFLCYDCRVEFSKKEGFMTNKNNDLRKITRKIF